MSSKPTASMMERRHPETTHIDSLATLDMLTLLHKDDKRIADAVEACLPAIARLMDDGEVRQRLGEAGRARVEDQYNLHRNIDRLAAILRRRLGGEHGHE